jgi:hypothetical protein
MRRHDRVYLQSGAALFPDAPASVRVFDRDLVAAGLASWGADGKIQKKDSRGRTLDIHSLRGTFASMLAAAGVPLATAQVLMRHSTPALTARHYVDPAMLDTAGAVERLPDFSPAESARAHVAQAGSTGHEPDAGKGVTDGVTKWAFSSDKTRHMASISGNSAEKYQPDTERQGVKITGNNDGAFQGVACSGRGERDGSGARIRTADTWIMIPLL